VPNEFSVIPYATMFTWCEDDAVVMNRKGKRGIKGVPHWKVEKDAKSKNNKRERDADEPPLVAEFRALSTKPGLLPPTPDKGDGDSDPDPGVAEEKQEEPPAAPEWHYVCEDCGKPVADDANFCPACGGAL
jgi:hypothetical protein